jgi:hypothetical protein
MYLPIDPQLEAIKESIRTAVMERDVFIAVIFFALEAVLLAWLLPKLLDKRAERREERRRLPTRRIAADRIADSIRDLLRAGDSLYRALSVADSIAGTEDLLDKAGQQVDEFNKYLEAMTEHLKHLSSEKPRLAVPAKLDPEKAAKAKNLRRLNLNKNLFIEPNVDELIQSVEDTQRAIDAFLPVFSVEMIECAAKLYERLAQTEKPYRALKRAFLNPNDESSVMGATKASVNARELLPALKQLCDLIEVDTSKLADELRFFPEEEQQNAKMGDFLYLHFDGSYKQLLIDSGLL